MAGERFIHELKPQELLQPLSCVVLFLVLHSCLALEATPQNHNLSQHKCSTQRTLLKHPNFPAQRRQQAKHLRLISAPKSKLPSLLV